MLQRERINQALDLTESVWDEMRQGYVDDDAIGEAVELQIMVNRIVWKMNDVRYGKGKE